MPYKRNLIIILIVLLKFSLASAQWKMSKQLEKFDDNSRHVLTWKKKKLRQIYKPDKLPLGLIRSQKISLQKSSYFLTTWANSGQSVTFRVFNPEVKNTPLCEYQSFSDTSKLRLKKKYLQISILKNPTDPVSKKKNNFQWVNCKKI